jgi:hypothetical protein
MRVLDVEEQRAGDRVGAVGDGLEGRLDAVDRDAFSVSWFS